jgi:phage gpG-like protein
MKTNDGDKFGLAKMKAQFFQKLLPELPRQLGQHILIFFRGNYNKEGYEPGTAFVPWKDRKYAVNRKLLVKTGTLRDGIKVTSQTFGKISIENDVPYASYHNEGTAKLPKRPIIYNSKQLEKEIETIINNQLKKVFKIRK